MTTLHVRERKDWLLINMLGKISEASKQKKKFKSNYNESIIKKAKKKKVHRSWSKRDNTGRASGLATQ